MARAVGFTHPREAPSVLSSAPLHGDGALVRLEACGLGAADFGFFQLDALPRTPLIPGLEAVGVIEEACAGSPPVGTRVGLTPLVSTCRSCALCERGLERWCSGATLSGWHVDGLLRERVRASPEQLWPLRETDDPVTWAPLFASGWTAFSAVRATRLGAGHRLAVFGLGGVGHLVAQLGQETGFEVTAVELDSVRRGSWPGARAQGPGPDSFDAAVVATPSTQAIQQALRGLRRGGTLVLAAASPAVRFDLSLFDVVMRGVRLEPAFLGARSELAELLDLMRAGRVKPTVRPVPVEDVPRVFWDLRDGGFAGRLVATF